LRYLWHLTRFLGQPERFSSDFHALEAIKLKLVTLLLPEAYLEGLDKLVGQGMYPSRSAAIRFAVVDLLKRELWRQEREAREAVKEEVVTTRKGTMVKRKSRIKHPTATKQPE